ncbi:MAG: hypothetical protein WCP81_07930 [Actinomycetes bacterium]
MRVESLYAVGHNTTHACLYEPELGIRPRTVSPVMTITFVPEGTLGTEGRQQQANYDNSKDPLHGGHTLRFQLRAGNTLAVEMTKRVTVRRGVGVPQSSMSTRWCA